MLISTDDYQRYSSSGSSTYRKVDGLLLGAVTTGYDGSRSMVDWRMTDHRSHSSTHLDRLLLLHLQGSKIPDLPDARSHAHRGDARRLHSCERSDIILPSALLLLLLLLPWTLMNTLEVSGVRVCHTNDSMTV